MERRLSGRRKRLLARATAQRVAIRPATPADTGAILAIEHAVFRTDRIERRAFRHAMRSPTIICLVAKEDGEILGYGIVERRRTSSAARLTSIAVAPHGLGRGIGKRLLAALERRAKAAGARRMRLEVRASNAAARALYEQAGYGIVDTLKEYYEDGATALRYERTIARA